MAKKLIEKEKTREGDQERERERELYELSFAEMVKSPQVHYLRSPADPNPSESEFFCQIGLYRKMFYIITKINNIGI